MRIFRTGILLLVICLMSPAAFAATSHVAIARPAFQFGTSGQETVTKILGQRDAAGYAVLGTTTGTFAGKHSAGGVDSFVRRVSSTGAVIRQFGTAGDDVVYDESGTTDVGATTGSLPGHTNAGGSDGFVWSFKSGGTAWVTRLGTSGEDKVVGIFTGHYGIYVLGTTTGAFSGQTNAGGTDYFVAQLSPASGAVKKLTQYGTAGDDRVVALSGSILDGGPCCGINDQLYVAGDTTGTFEGQTSHGGRDVFTRRIDVPAFPDLPDSTRQFGTAGDDQALAGVYDTVAGSTTGAFPGQTNHGGTDAFVANPGWAYQFGTSAADAATSLAPASEISVNDSRTSQSTDYLVAGRTAGTLPSKTSHGGVDAFAMKVGESGLRWRIQSGGSGDDEASGIASTSRGTVFGGTTSGSIDGQQSSGGTDAFVERVNWARPDVYVDEFTTYLHEYGRNSYGGPAYPLPMSKPVKVMILAANHGDQAEQMRIRGCGSTTVFTVRYYSSSDVTTAVRNGTFTLTSGVASSNGRPLLSAVFTPRPGATTGQFAPCKITLSSTAVPGVTDDLTLKVTRLH